MTFFPEIALHVTRPIRWDSDHVVLFDDETKEIAQEIVRCENGLDRTYIALDYFDASINRISAWVTGFRSFQKAPSSECIVYTECDAERTAGYEPDDKEDGSDGTVQDASARRRMGRVLQKMRRCSRGMV